MRGKGLCEQRSQHLVRDVELKTIIEPPEGLRWQEVFFQTHASAAAEERQSSFHGVLVPRERLVLAQACENALVVAYHVFAPPYAPLHRRCQVSDCQGRRRLWSPAPQLWDCGPCARLLCPRAPLSRSHHPSYRFTSLLWAINLCNHFFMQTWTMAIRWLDTVEKLLRPWARTPMYSFHFQRLLRWMRHLPRSYHVRAPPSHVESSCHARASSFLIWREEN